MRGAPCLNCVTPRALEAEPACCLAAPFSMDLTLQAVLLDCRLGTGCVASWYGFIPVLFFVAAPTWDYMNRHNAARFMCALMDRGVDVADDQAAAPPGSSNSSSSSSSSSSSNSSNSTTAAEGDEQGDVTAAAGVHAGEGGGGEKQENNESSSSSSSSSVLLHRRPSGPSSYSTTDPGSAYAMGKEDDYDQEEKTTAATAAGGSGAEQEQPHEPPAQHATAAGAAPPPLVVRRRCRLVLDMRKSENVLAWSVVRRSVACAGEFGHSFYLRFQVYSLLLFGCSCVYTCAMTFGSSAYDYCLHGSPSASVSFSVLLQVPGLTW